MSREAKSRFASANIALFFQLAVMLRRFFDNKIHKSTILHPEGELVGGCAECQFSTDRTLDLNAHFFRPEAESEQIHHFCYGRFRGHIVARRGAGSRQSVAADIAFGVYSSVDALGHVDNDYTSVHSIFDRAYEPRIGGGVARAECPEDYALDSRRGEQMLEYVFGDAGMQFEEHYVCVHIIMYAQGGVAGLTHQGILVEF